MMIKNHPFQNGNKRVAVITLYYFLSANDCDLRVSNLKLYGFAKEVALIKAEDKDAVISKIREFIILYSKKGI